MGLTYLGSALLGLVLKNLVGRRLLILASQLGMAVSHLGLGLYFHHLAELRREEEEGSGGAQTGGTGVRGNVTGSWSKEEASLGVVGWLPLPLLLSFTVSPIVVLLDRGLLCVGIFVCLSVSQSWRCLLVSYSFVMKSAPGGFNNFPGGLQCYRWLTILALAVSPGSWQQRSCPSGEKLPLKCINLINYKGPVVGRTPWPT